MSLYFILILNFAFIIIADSLIIKNNNFASSISLKNFVKNVLSIMVITSSLTFPILDDNGIVYADSTGKMSTKLTARKRYLPRIISGVREYNNVMDKKSDIEVFKKDELPSFIRAMSLYGASLRKGEVPDAVSREAEKITNEFNNCVNNNNNNQCIDILDQYLKFSKLSESSSNDYK